MFGFEKKLNPSPKETSLDANWYPRYEQAGAFQAYEYFDDSKEAREKQNQLFQDGEVRNPLLEYSKINVDDMRGREAALIQLKKDIVDQEQNDLVKQVYRWRINEKLAEIRMTIAAKQGDARRFSKYSEFVYGKPDTNIFAYTIHELRDTCEKATLSDNAQEASAAAELLAFLPKPQVIEDGFDKPSEDALALVKQETEKELAGLLKGASIDQTQPELAGQTLYDVFDTALKTLDVPGWSVVMSKDKKSISVNQEKKQVLIPESAKLAVQRVKGLLAHEIGTHVARRANGERSKLMLLGLGLDRYEQGEEGVTTLREQAIAGKADSFAGVEGHLAIGLALGLDGHPRDFRETYEILEKHFTFKLVQEKKDIEQAKQEAKKLAYDRCVRTFRGTDGQQKGVAFTKDIIYRQGNIAVWDVVGKNPDELHRFSIGKYDPSNPRHVWVLDQLGITDKDLESLEAMK